MRIRKRYLIGALLILVCLLGAALYSAQAQTGGDYDLTWNTLNGGGRMAASDGSYTLYGSFGQPDAGPTMSGGGYSLTGGFLGAIPAYSISLPLIKK